MRRFRPIGAGRLPSELVTWARTRMPGPRPLRIALDGPRFVDSAPLLRGLVEEFTRAGHPTASVDSRTFLRDASVRLEYGRTDVESFYSGWLDIAALQREVLRPLAEADPPTFLPSLRDPETNRSTRTQPRELARNGVLIVSGELLLGIGLSVDASIHLAVSRHARKRLVEPDWSWTLAAYDRYDIDVDPISICDVAVRFDDPGHPAISLPPD